MFRQQCQRDSKLCVACCLAFPHAADAACQPAKPATMLPPALTVRGPTPFLPRDSVTQISRMHLVHSRFSPHSSATCGRAQSSGAGVGQLLAQCRSARSGKGSTGMQASRGRHDHPSSGGGGGASYRQHQAMPTTSHLRPVHEPLQRCLVGANCEGRCGHNG